MATAYKNLGQAAPGATTPTDLYTVPGATQAVVSSFMVCNRGATATTFRLSRSVGGGATANKDYIYYDVAIPGNDCFIATIGLALAATDVVRVYAGNASLSFSLDGMEIA